MGNRWTAGQEEGKEAGEGNILKVEWSGKAKAQSFEKDKRGVQAEGEGTPTFDPECLSQRPRAS